MIIRSFWECHIQWNVIGKCLVKIYDTAKKFSNKVVSYFIILGYQNNMSQILDKWLLSLQVGSLGIIFVVIAQKSLKHCTGLSLSACGTL